MVGAGFLMASNDTSTPVAAPAIKLTTSQCALGSVFCADLGSLLGSASAVSTGPAASATANASSISDFIAIFVSDGTAAHPNAGLLIGNGYNYGAADDTLRRRSGCNGGNGGFLFGNGGSGYIGGDGGNADLYGNGGAGGADVSRCQRRRRRQRRQRRPVRRTVRLGRPLRRRRRRGR